MSSASIWVLQCLTQMVMLFVNSENINSFTVDSCGTPAPDPHGNAKAAQGATEIKYVYYY